MAYRIQNIKDYDPQTHPLYFLDANVWITALYGKASPSYRRHYIDFVDAIVNLNEIKDPKLNKKIKHKPKIVVTSLLVSEIINAYMRNVAMRLYYQSKQEDFKNKNFKKDYRKTEDYERQLKLLISDFKSYEDYIEVYDDNLKELGLFTFLPSLNADCDFNDLFYYYRFQEQGIPIVTDDSDFIFQDIEIITANRNLLNL